MGGVNRITLFIDDLFEKINLVFDRLTYRSDASYSSN